jgi:hypothetical protein
MTPHPRFTAAVLALLTVAPAIAQQPRSAEQWAQVQEGELAQLDLQSIRKYGDSQARFEVLIGRADATRAAPEDYVPRTVRYMANCDESTITLAAVGLYDRNGQVAKTLIVPPGAGDAVQPAKGSEEAKWIRRACMF